MATHPGMLLAYDDDGNIIATLEHLILRDEAGRGVGLVDFQGHEDAGGEHTEAWVVEQHERDLTTGVVTTRPARGSKAWPEWLGEQAHNFKVELEGPPGRKRIKALVHKQSGHRRERSAIEAAVNARIAAAGSKPADIRDLVGGPDRPIHLDEQGRSAPRPKSAPRPNLPVVAARGAKK